MARQVTKSIAKLERLMSLYDAYNRADIGDDGSFEAARRIIRQQNELLDQCVECGMSPSDDEFAFAGRVVTQFLLSA